ncbi:hypothetical protein [Serratia fonticola]|uniref:hypothetical protein n=1 Tax=Serratia fonticola TaxID=47917 RepID=UPI0027E7B860|nr:hypothetical protein [Serratia fonticola]MDQ7209425.1 hypothetical protein [Serratia fonticola]HBE9082234.1 hypothetical protein [Serratia fonticola]HBE9092724.1 hypothetical protein [Serratia fonticola]
MQNKINLIEKNRQRIALAYLDFCQRHYGGKWADVLIPRRRKAVRVDVTQKSIEEVMRVYIEDWLRAEYGIAEGQKQIAVSYDAMLTGDGKLTPLGATSMEDAFVDAVAYKLLNPGSTLLQVVSQ